MVFKTILLEQIEAGIFLVTVNRPQPLNALNAETLDEIAAAIGKIAADDAARVLLVTGASDKAFVAGADITAMRDATIEEARDFSEKGMRVMHVLEALPVPVIALVHGYALGGGCEFALACDWKWRAPSCRKVPSQCGLRSRRCDAGVISTYLRLAPWRPTCLLRPSPRRIGMRG